MHSPAADVPPLDATEQDDHEDTAVSWAPLDAGPWSEDAMDLHLDGTTALVTGAASGIGRAVVRALAAEGVRVALLDRDAVALREAAGESVDPVLLAADVTDEGQVAAAVDEAVRRLGGLNAVVCCAGVSGPVGMPIEETALAAWNRVFAVNVTGAFLVLKHALPALRASAAAAVVLLASDSAVVASPGMAPYAASKAALVQFGRALSVDLADTDIRVNAVAPSIVDTPMSRGDLGAAAFVEPAFPVQTADEVAGHVAYLVSPRSRAINGTTLLSDFGFTARSGFPA